MTEDAIPPLETPETTAPEADGVPRHIDRNWVKADRLAQLIRSLVFAGLTLGAALFVRGLDGMPDGLAPFILPAWGVLVAARLTFGQVWPGVAWRHLTWALDEQGVVIRRGVFWRSETLVPRNRIQHTDVNRGPVARRFGLATIVLHTAGTVSATVALEGLAEDQAFALRDFLIVGGTGDAV